MTEHHKQRHRVQLSPLLSAAGSALFAMVLTWLAVPSWLPRFWIALLVGVVCFGAVLYYATVSIYQRMARTLFLVLISARFGLPTIQFYWQSGEENCFQFVLAASDKASTIVFCVLFVVCVIADLFLTWLKRKGSCGEDVSSSLKIAASDVNSSVLIQNSPGAQVTYHSPAQKPQAPILDHTGILVDVLTQQATVIDRTARVRPRK